MYLIYFGILCAFFFWYLNGMSFIKSKYSRFRDLNGLVATRYKNACKIIWISLVMVAKMYWIQFLHWANSSVEHLDKKTAIISYVLNGKLYRIVVHQRRGPCSVLLVTDENGEDVSDIVLPFLGPNDDWHKKDFTPNFWQKESLNFELASGEQMSFSKDEKIHLT